MKSKKLWKQGTTLLLSMMLLVPAPMVSAAEVTPSSGMEQEESRMSEAETDKEVMAAGRTADGFDIDNGVLKKYTGTAAEVVIPEGVTSISDRAFFCCITLRRITIPESVASIGMQAFSECSSLTEITISEGVESIGDGVFSGCSSLTEIRIPKSVESIGNEVFVGCSNMQNLQVDPDNAKYSSEEQILYDKDKTTLLYCPARKTGVVSIPENVVNIQKGAFNGCGKLTQIVIPAGVTNIGSGTFQGCSSLKGITLPEGVVQLGDFAFYECSKLESIIIPKGVESIGHYGFSGCSSLTKMVIPEGVTNIGGGAFSKCGSLKEITLPKGVTSIESDTFSQCSSLKGLTLPEGVKSIGDGAFSDCSSLTQIVIPKGVKSIGDGAFWGCRSLKEITLPEGVESIGQRVFLLCENLTQIVIPKGVKSIGEWAFWGCDNLKGLTLPEGIESIGEKAFFGCGSLTRMNIPKSVTHIGDKAFYHCGSMKKLQVDGNNAKYCSDNNILYNKSKTKMLCCPGGITGEVTIPNGVTSIEEDMFFHCEKLTAVKIAKTVKSIGEYAFSGCKSLTEIVIPEGVESIGGDAFGRCDKLESIIIPNSVKKIGVLAFDSCPQLTIYGKAGSYAQKYAKKYKIPFSTGKPKAAQSLSVAQTYRKTYDAKPFKLNVKVKKGNGTLSYSTSNKKVAVADKNGKVTIKGTGIATITVTAKETSKYKKTSVQITIKVSPASPKALAVKARGGKKLKVSWKMAAQATGYDIQYSTDRKFKNKKTTKTLTVNKSRTTSTIIKNLVKGKKYYVRIRSYKNVKVEGKTQKLYSAWSSVKNVKTIP